MPTINSEAYFSELPKANIQRSIFRMPFGHKTSFNVGEVIPFFVGEILPGDTFKMRTSIVARLQTLLTPIMDNVNLEISWWFEPMRLVWDHTKNFFGENEDGPWTMDQVKYRIPYLTYPTDQQSPDEQVGFQTGTIADYMGVPVGFQPGNAPDISDANYPSVLPFRSYAHIINEYWRDQNLQQPCVIHRDDVIRAGSNGSNYVTDLELGGKPFIAARYHDYFSSALPAPQKSESVSIFGNLISDRTLAPVEAYDGRLTFESLDRSALGFRGPIVGLNLPSSGNAVERRLVTSSSPTTSGGNDFNMVGTQNNVYGSTVGFYPQNLWANLNIPQATITQLRLAFQLQKYFERLGRGGSRYREYIQEFFGISNGDARMQVPEYLGGRRIPLSIHQVANTSQSDGADLGDLGAMSNTSDVAEDFFHSFSEHGFLIGLIVCRFPNTYSQGLERFWSRRDVLEFYNPVFAHLSEQPIYRREIFLEGDQTDASNNADSVWGYNEAWADYRYKPSRVSGEMRPEAAQSLASWHLADDYESTPYLSSDWLKTNKGTVDRVLAVGSDVSNQVFCDIFCDIEATRPMPVHSVPGLADHF